MDLLKLIKKKRVNVALLDITDEFYEYNGFVANRDRQLSREEYNDLKKWIKEE